MFRRVLSIICTLCLILPLSVPACAAETAAVSTSAVSAILTEASTGRVLYAWNAGEQRPIASLTKLMTALLVAEKIPDLDREVTILPEDTGIEGSSMYLAAGDTYTVRQLLYGLLLVSGNDAALALARICAGDADTFVEWMNARAAELGMDSTRFSCPNGLQDEGNYSTAADLAVLAAACLRNETLAEIMATRSITVGTQTLVNHNKLLWRYEGCTGLKTGYTDAAGRTLVSSACRNGMTLIAVTLCDRNDWADHAALLDYGFSAYTLRALCTQGEAMGSAPVSGSLVPLCPLCAAETVLYPLRAEESVSAAVTLRSGLKAPLSEGTPAGRVTYYLNGQEICSGALCCACGAADNSCPAPTGPEALLRRIGALFRLT